MQKLSESAQSYAVLAEEFKSIRRDIERIGTGVDKINERHESIRMNCAGHCAETKIAIDTADAAIREISEHKQNHLAWYGLIVAVVALLNMPIGDILRRIFK